RILAVFLFSFLRAQKRNKKASGGEVFAENYRWFFSDNSNTACWRRGIVRLRPALQKPSLFSTQTLPMPGSRQWRGGEASFFLHKTALFPQNPEKNKRCWVS